MKVILVLILAITSILNASAVYSEHRHKIIKGVAVTGTNRLYGKPVTDFGPPLGTAGFYNVGVYNPGSSVPLQIDSNTPGSALLATAVDPGFLAMVGLPVSLIDHSLENIPLNSVTMNVSPDGEVRVTPSSTLEVDPLVPNQAYPESDVTLKSWLSASGLARISCSDHSSTLSIRLSRLIPNRIYTIWGIFESAAGQMMAVPMGGAPNVVAVNARGVGYFSRKLGFCPFDVTEAGSRLLAIDVVFHSDHQVYGFVPDLALKGLITGTVTHTQLEFVISGRPLLETD